jgi:anti-anti-sigma factor
VALMQDERRPRWEHGNGMEDLYVLRPSGFIDAENGLRLRHTVGDVIAARPQDILIDCAQVEFMDSSGFGCLVSTLKKVREQGRQLFLCGLGSQLRTVLELTGTDRVFTVFPSYDDCIAHLRQSRSGG